MLALTLAFIAAAADPVSGFTLVTAPKAATPLALAGVSVGDQVVSVDGCPTSSPESFAKGVKALSKKAKGGAHTVELIREGSAFVVWFDEAYPEGLMKPADSLVLLPSCGSPSQDRVVPAWEGSNRIGVKIMSLAKDSKLLKSGLDSADVVTHIGGCSVSGDRATTLLLRLANRKPTDAGILVEVRRRGGNTAYVTAALGKPVVASAELPVRGDRPECEAFLSQTGPTSAAQ